MTTSVAGAMAASRATAGIAATPDPAGTAAMGPTCATAVRPRASWTTPTAMSGTGAATPGRTRAPMPARTGPSRTTTCCPPSSPGRARASGRARATGPATSGMSSPTLTIGLSSPQTSRLPRRRRTRLRAPSVARRGPIATPARTGKPSPTGPCAVTGTRGWIGNHARTGRPARTAGSARTGSALTGSALTGSALRRSLSRWAGPRVSLTHRSCPAARHRDLAPDRLAPDRLAADRLAAGRALDPRPAIADDDPLTSPSFPRIAADDSRSYRRSRSTGADSGYDGGRGSDSSRPAIASGRQPGDTVVVSVHAAGGADTRIRRRELDSPPRVASCQCLGPDRGVRWVSGAAARIRCRARLSGSRGHRRIPGAGRGLRSTRRRERQLFGSRKLWRVRRLPGSGQLSAGGDRRVSGSERHSDGRLPAPRRRYGRALPQIRVQAVIRACRQFLTVTGPT